MDTRGITSTKFNELKKKILLLSNLREAFAALRWFFEAANIAWSHASPSKEQHNSP